MDRSRVIVAGALGLFLLSRVEHESAFAAAGAGRQSALRGAMALRSAAGPQPAAGQAGQGLPAAAAAAALAMGAVGLSLSRGASRQRVQRHADASGLEGSGPVVTYTKALMDAASKTKESVPVTKDVMRIRNLFADDDFLQELLLINNEVGRTQLDRARDLVKLVQPLESSIMEKFIVFLAKKRRLLALKSICKEYVASLYFNNSIAPVIVRSSQILSDEQKDAIKDKMRAKLGVEDIKLVCQVDAGLLGGFVIEWGFVDPENLVAPSEGVDCSLRTYLEKAALNQGVLVDV